MDIQAKINSEVSHLENHPDRLDDHWDFLGDDATMYSVHWKTVLMFLGAPDNADILENLIDDILALGMGEWSCESKFAALPRMLAFFPYQEHRVNLYLDTTPTQEQIEEFHLKNEGGEWVTYEASDNGAAYSITRDTIVEWLEKRVNP